MSYKHIIYSKCFAVIIATAIALLGLSTEAFASKGDQLKKEEINATKLIIQVDSPYYLATNLNIGDKNVFRKMETVVRWVDGKVFAPISLVEHLGYQVSWDAGTKSVTIKNESQSIRLIQGSEFIVIEELEKESRKVPMGVGAKFDKNGKGLIPIELFAQNVMGAEVQYDTITKTMGINISKDEFDQTRKLDKAAKENLAKALPYIAGGEFMDITLYKNKVENIGGTIVIFPTEKPSPEQRDLVRKNAKSLKGKAVVAVCGERINYINPNNLNTISYNKNRKKVNSLNPIITWKVQFSEDGNMVCVDNGRLAFEYDAAKNFWNERTAPAELGTKKQLICKKLDNILNNGNLYAINTDEVKQYKRTGSDKGLTSFQTINYSDGLPAFVLITNENGISGENLGYFRTSMDRLNEIDATMLHELTEKFGMDMVAVKEKSIIEAFKEVYALAVYATSGENEIIFLNQKFAYEFDSFSAISKSKIFVSTMVAIINESRALYHQNLTRYSSKNHSLGNLLIKDNPGFDKAAYSEIKLNGWKRLNVLTKNEEFYFEVYIKTTREWYEWTSKQ